MAIQKPEAISVVYLRVVQIPGGLLRAGGCLWLRVGGCRWLRRCYLLGDRGRGRCWCKRAP